MHIITSLTVNYRQRQRQRVAMCQILTRTVNSDEKTAMIMLYGSPRFPWHKTRHCSMKSMNLLKTPRDLIDGWFPASCVLKIVLNCTNKYFFPKKFDDYTEKIMNEFIIKKYIFSLCK